MCEFGKVSTFKLLKLPVTHEPVPPASVSACAHSPDDGESAYFPACKKYCRASGLMAGVAMRGPVAGYTGAPRPTLDTPGREWALLRDYVLVKPDPINKVCCYGFVNCYCTLDL